jgi:ABC-type multidrug transport system fused ATPase/permease subunit
MALVAFFIFVSLGIILYLILKRRALLNGRILAEQQVKSNQEVYEVLESFRETYVRNRRYFYATQIKKSRMELASSLALKSYLPNVGKYAFETGVTLGVLIFAGIQFSVSDTGTALVTLGLFLGASSRIAPSIIRLQQNALTIRGATGTSVKVLTLVDELRFINPIEPVADSIEIEHKGFEAKISLRDVSFRYPGSDRLALNTISLELEPNKLYAIVGPSGAGKSTLIDLILGILTPDDGEVEISSVSPKIAIQTWPGAIAYLPQNVTIISGSISENISVGYSIDESHVDLVNSAIEISQLSDFVKGLPLGAGTNVGDRGTKLSGGQRQRLGIARALFTSPKLLFLDEATSALDGQTEELVSNAILDLKGLTVITIAHRLSTIRRADSVIYLNNGSVEAVGSFQEVRNLVKEFDHQINLMSKQNDFE